MTYDSSYSCNLRYISDEILRRKLPVELVWVGPQKGKIKEGDFPEGVKVVRRGSYSMYEEQASAKIWIDNALNCVWYGMPKKKEQIYINTWHGSMGIKRLSGNKNWMRKARRCDRLTDYCVSNSRFEEEVYHNTFWPNVPVLKYGHARNDVFFNKALCEELRKKALQYFELDEETKLFLYAPTFRDNGNKYEQVDYLLLKEALENKFGGTWVILVRLHFKDRKRNFVSSEYIKDASCYGDMQELLPAIDIGMTDYSSWAYDYILTRRPMFFYAPDSEEYNQTRGMYYSLESTGFPLAYNNLELINAIESFCDETYQEKVTAFLNEKGCYETGTACKQIVDKLIESMQCELGDSADME